MCDVRSKETAFEVRGAMCEAMAGDGSPELGTSNLELGPLSDECRVSSGGKGKGLRTEGGRSSPHSAALSHRKDMARHPSHAADSVNETPRRRSWGESLRPLWATAYVVLGAGLFLWRPITTFFGAFGLMLLGLGGREFTRIEAIRKRSPVFLACMLVEWLAVSAAFVGVGLIEKELPIEVRWICSGAGIVLYGVYCVIRLLKWRAERSAHGKGV